MSDYTEIDAKIVMLIASGKTSFCAISLRCAELADKLSPTAHTGYRVTDRRLQSLRKRGLIEFMKGKWLIKKAAT